MDGLDDLNSGDAALVGGIMQAHDYDSLKKTQQLAFEDGILDPGNHLLVAETGNGKTLCAEAVTRKTLEDSGQVAYLVPSRQLVRDKRDTIQEWASDDYQVGFAPRGYQNADVVVATFDSFYRAMLRNVGGTRNLDLVVLDDFHEIYGGFRGPEIEKSIAATLYEDIEIFAMSATLGNPDELADWMDADLTVSPEGREIEIEEAVVEVGTGEKKDQLADFIRREQNKAPFLVFNYAKPWTESRAEAIAKSGIFRDSSDQDFRRKLREKVDGEVTDTLENLARMMEAGVAFHHADLPSNIKQWIEDLYDEGDIQCLCATTTIAYGFDAPVQTVVVADIQRGPNPVGVWEYVQWIGRAARPGYNYDKGYAYTLTDDPEETIERYFEPHRVLEPVGTHIEADEAFHKLMLELVATGWDTPHEIEAFVKGMLYWEQMKQLGSWGRQFSSKDERLNKRLRDGATWLEKHEFVSEKQTARQFKPTPLGDGTVQFYHNSFADGTLIAIKEFFDWIQESDHEKLTQLALLEKTSRLFYKYLNEKSASEEVTSRLQEYDLPVDEPGITAGVMRWYWMQNLDNREIESRAEIDATYISSTARRLADVIDATQYLFDAAIDARRPDWFESLVFRVERGVRRDEVPLVENVSGLGRYRVRMLRQYLSTSDILAVQDLPDSSFWEQLTAFYENVGNAGQFEDILKGNITGIGPKTAQNIRMFVEAGEIDDLYNTRDDASIRSSSSKSTETGFTRGTTLDDF